MESFLVNLFRELDIRVFVLITISNIHVCLTSCNSFKKKLRREKSGRLALVIEVALGRFGQV